MTNNLVGFSKGLKGLEVGTFLAFGLLARVGENRI